MKRLLLAICVTAAVSACGGPGAAPSATAAKESTAAATPAATSAADRFAVQAAKADLKLPACAAAAELSGKDSCPQIDIRLLKTSDPWINSVLDQRIAAIVGSVASPEQDAATVSAPLQASVDAIVAASTADSKDRPGMAYAVKLEPKYLGAHKQLQQFEIATYTFTGGAHGMSTVEPIVLDPVQKRRVELADVTLPNAEARLLKLLDAPYVAMIKSLNPTNDQQLAQYRTDFPLFVSKKYRFAEDGMHFHYDPYDVSYYAAGAQNFVIPYAQLSGVIKPEYLP